MRATVITVSGYEVARGSHIDGPRAFRDTIEVSVADATRRNSSSPSSMSRAHQKMGIAVVILLPCVPIQHADHGLQEGLLLRPFRRCSEPDTL